MIVIPRPGVGRGICSSLHASRNMDSSLTRWARNDKPKLFSVPPWWVFYFPMQKLLKMRLRISSAVVAPVISSSCRSAP